MSLSSKQIQTIQVLPVHNTLKSTIEQFLTIKKAPTTTLGGVSSSSSSVILREAEFFDFGIRFKITATATSSSSSINAKRSSTSIHTYLHVSVPEWERCKDDSIKRLTDIYKNSFNTGTLNNDDDNDVAIMNNNNNNNKKKKEISQSTEPSFDFFINVNDALNNHFGGSIEECSTSLAQIRIQCIGSPIYYAMERIVLRTQQQQQQQQQHQYKAQKRETINLIQSHPRCGECRCIGTNEKVLVIFTVRIDDEMERALARVFLQQFVGAQKQIAQTPHCEFRRGNDTPKELLSCCSGGENNDDDATNSSQQQLPLGYLAFTFFPMHLKTPERLRKAVELMVNFLPYLDKHLKSTKSFMHSRMRAKKNDLLRELKETNKIGTTTTSASVAANGDGEATNKQLYCGSSFGGQQQQKLKGAITTSREKYTTTTTTTKMSSQQHKHFSKPHHFVPMM